MPEKKVEENKVANEHEKLIDIQNHSVEMKSLNKSPPDDVHLLRAMVFNNFWYTNFVADSNGVMEFQFDLAWRNGTATNVADLADALVTDQSGITLGVVCADCAPVLIADRAARVIGCAHAGWRGALAGVIEATVAAMALPSRSARRKARVMENGLASRTIRIRTPICS